jgi:hypothetical protein
VNAMPVLKAAAAGAGRRWVQTVVMFVVVGVTAASAVLGLTLATTSGSSFQTALAKRNPPDLAVEIDATKVTAAELAGTRHLRGVTATAGPYPETTITLAAAAGGWSVSEPLRVVGRASSHGLLDDLTCFTAPPGSAHAGGRRGSARSRSPRSRRCRSHQTAADSDRSVRRSPSRACRPGRD